MIIKVLNQNYRCGCRKGLSELKIPGLIAKLNAIIDWDSTKFPETIVPDKSKEEIKKYREEVDSLKKELKEAYNNKEDEKTKEIIEKIDSLNKTYIKENREFLGKDPELKPGNVFEIKPGQIVAVEDPDTLILIVSETGAGALDRLWKEEISPEIEMFFNGGVDTLGITWKLIEKENISPDYDKEYRPAYKIYKAWKDSFLERNNIPLKDFNIEFEMDSENFILPVNFILKDWSILYKSIQLDEDMVEDAVKEFFGWYYNND